MAFRKSDSRSRRSKKKWTTGYRNNLLRNTTSLMLNPFSNYSALPKIPDGACTLSTGVREQCTFPIPGGSGCTYFLLYPGVIGNFAYTPYIPSKSTINLKSDLFEGGSQDNGQFSIANTTTLVEKCRIVSCGMSIKCTSNAANNDGYFEAIRLTSTSLASEEVNMSTLAQNPSYVHGKLKDIESYSWQLKPTNASHGFYNMYYGPPDGSSITSDSSAVHNSNYDLILVRVTAGSSSKTDLFVHTITNFELQYDESSPMSKFQTTCPKDIAAVERVRSVLTSDLKAARSIYHVR